MREEQSDDRSSAKAQGSTNQNDPTQNDPQGRRPPEGGQFY
jgi:hypothetical protein